MEEEGHVVNCFSFGISFVDAKIRDVIKRNFHVIALLDIHEGWHQLCDLDPAIFGPSELFNCKLAALIDKYGRVPEHGLVSLDLIFDLSHFLEGLVMLLLVDVVNDHSIISFDELGVLDAFINFSMTL